jgi:hypothetical protein
MEREAEPEAAPASAGPGAPGQRFTRPPALYALGVTLLVCLGAGWRLLTALSVPVVSGDDPLGLLRTDPALIYYISERILEGGGLPPADFRADPRIESPLSTDIPAMFTVGQEFLVAWVYLLLGGRVPLHIVALYLMSLVASTAVIGVAGLARELTDRRAWGCFAGLLYLVTAGSYRTPGYILVREDLSYPLFALHLYLLARAARVRSAASIALAALAAILALATWHAMSFVFTLEVACVFAWYLRTGEGPMREKRAVLFPLLLAMGSLLVPVLRSKLFLLSLPMQMLLVMYAVPRLPMARRSGTPRGDLGRAAISLLLLLVLGVACGAIRDGLAPGSGHYAHVVDMMLAKLRYLGELPPDPNELSHDARLLWQGIFATGSPLLLAKYLGVLALLAPLSLLAYLEPWWRGREAGGGARAAVTVLLGIAALVLALLVQRLIALAALLLPVLAVLLLASSLAKRGRAWWAAGSLLAQLLVAPVAFDRAALEAWYHPRLVQQLEGTLRYIQRNLDPRGSIAADFVTSAAVLAHTDHAVVLQPKYETPRSRARIERFIVGLYHESPEAFARILENEFQARYLLIDAGFLRRARYEAGLRNDSRPPARGSAAYRLLSDVRNSYSTIPGYRLLYESRGLERRVKVPRYRLYDLAPEGEEGPEPADGAGSGLAPEAERTGTGRTDRGNPGLRAHRRR